MGDAAARDLIYQAPAGFNSITAGTTNKSQPHMRGEQSRRSDEMAPTPHPPGRQRRRSGRLLATAPVAVVLPVLLSVAVASSISSACIALLAAD